MGVCFLILQGFLVIRFLHVDALIQHFVQYLLHQDKVHIMILINNNNIHLHAFYWVFNLVVKDILFSGSEDVFLGIFE